MATEIRLPQWSMGMRDGTVARWLKKEGEPVTQGEPIAEIEAAKVTGVVEAPVTGVLARILVPEGVTVPVRTPLCVVVAPGEALAAASAAAPSTGTVAETAPSQHSEAPRVQATPVARRLAQEHGIDLSQIQGSGPGGRIVDQDVRQAIELLAGSKPLVIPMTGLRSTIAQRMLMSLQKMAQVTLTTEADVTDLVILRDELKKEGEVSFTGLVVRATALTLREHPRLNARIDGQDIRLLPDVHIGVAVALEDGLIVPVVRNADRKSLREIARETEGLGQKARDGRLSPDEVTGGTFTVTNLGMYGVDAFTPIINPPEVAILGVGRVVEKPTRKDGDVLWRQMMTLSLTFDHRAVDGAPAAAFLKALAGRLESLADLR